MPNVGDYAWTTASSSSAVTNQYVTITNTWDASSSAARPIVWNGAEIGMGAPYAPPSPAKEKAIDWLRRRVEEYRVPLLEAA